MKFTLDIIYTKLTKLLSTLGGILVGSYIPLMNTSVKLGLLVLWMTADSVVSIILTIDGPIIQIPFTQSHLGHWTKKF